MMGVVSTPTRSRPTGRSQASRNVDLGGGSRNRSPGQGAVITSSRAAVSRTARVSTPPIASAGPSTPYGPGLTRPRLALNPTTPHALAGIRSEPPPSDPWATGTIPAATAAAEPPLDPPADRLRSHGVRAGGAMSGSV